MVRSTQWQTGQSGNPAGKPKGSKHKITLLREQLQEHLPEAIEALLKKMREGDVMALRLFLERTVPAIRPVDLPVEFGTRGSLTKTAEHALKAAGRGELSPNEAKEVASAALTAAKVQELEELARRVEVLEQALERPQEARSPQGGTQG